MPDIIDITKASKITTHICDQLGIKRRALKGKKKDSHLVFARMLVAHAIRKETNLTLMETAKLLARRHTTIINHCQAVDLMLEGNSPVINRLLKEVEDICVREDNNE